MPLLYMFLMCNYYYHSSTMSIWHLRILLYLKFHFIFLTLYQKQYILVSCLIYIQVCSVVKNFSCFKLVMYRIQDPDPAGSWIGKKDPNAVPAGSQFKKKIGSGSGRILIKKKYGSGSYRILTEIRPIIWIQLVGKNIE